VELLLALLLAPLQLGLIRRVKARFAGRTGPPLVQAYLDLWKLLHKSAVYSRTTTWLFRSGPVLSLACTIGALSLVPLASLGSSLAFPGDLVLVVYLLALGRFASVLAALDTGSSFEGMGASREASFAALAEPGLLLCLASLARITGDWSLSGVYAGLTPAAWLASSGVLVLVALALFGVLLVENARIPFDDPTTHLELTMIHEVMALDHGGPDLAAIELGSLLRLWLFSALLAGLVVPLRTGEVWIDAAAQLAGMAGIAVAIGCVESSLARFRLLRIPQILLAIMLLALISVLLVPGSGVA
jgi:formate hydrogenlyase subunit 4